MVSLKTAAFRYAKSKISSTTPPRGGTSAPERDITISARLKPSLATGTKRYAVYATKKGLELKPKRQTPSEKGPVGMLNRYYETQYKKEIEFEARDRMPPKDIAHIYAAKSRVMRSTENLLAVKTRDGEKGWITREGEWIGLEDFRMILHSLDSLSVAALYGVDLLAAFDSLSKQKQAEFVDRMRLVSWDEFFKSLYPTKDDPAPVESQASAYLDLLELLGDLAGWDPASIQ